MRKFPSEEHSWHEIRSDEPASGQQFVSPGQSTFPSKRGREIPCKLSGIFGNRQLLSLPELRATKGNSVYRGNLILPLERTLWIKFSNSFARIPSALAVRNTWLRFGRNRTLKKWILFWEREWNWGMFGAVNERINFCGDGIYCGWNYSDEFNSLTYMNPELKFQKFQTLKSPILEYPSAYSALLQLESTFHGLSNIST